MNLSKSIEKGFFGFWVRRYKVSYLAIFLIIIAGLFSLYTIPKESSPDIKFGIIAIQTVYTGVNPNDIDSLITDKIEKEIDDISGIKKINSTSAIGLSSITVELFNGVNTRDVLTDIKDAVDKVDLPEAAEDPFVVEMSSSNELMFEVLLYGDESKFSKFELIGKSQIIKNQLEGKFGIAGVDLSGADLQGFGLTSGAGEYEIKVLIDKSKMENLGLSLRDISNAIRSYNKNTPIGNYTIGDLKYDFRFDGELSTLDDLKNIVIKGAGGSNITLNNIAEFKNEYKDDSIKKLGFANDNGYNYTAMVFNKAEGTNIFDVTDGAKQGLKDLIDGSPDFEGLQFIFTKDMSEIIKEDYGNLGSTAIQTIILVFCTIFLFVGIRESIIASLLLPLSFLITFLVLDLFGYSLNFLTNFSLVLTLGIAIDTVIVIIEGASEKIKLGYSKHSAILLAVQDFKAPLIAGTLTTLVAFLPLMFLPGVIGKFLAYIPITIFSTLVAALILSLTISSALFIKIAKEGTKYHKDKKLEKTFSTKQKEFLHIEREGKIELGEDTMNVREKFLLKLSTWYYYSLKGFIKSRKLRLLSIFSPIIVLIFTFIFLSPQIGFILFPQTDESIISGSIETKIGADKDVLVQYLPTLNEYISKHPEVKVYNLTISGNKIDLYIELLEKNIRKEENMRHVFLVEEELVADLKSLESYGLKVSIATLSNGPPTGKPIGIKLIAANTNKVEELKNVSEIFEAHLKTLEGVKNPSTTSTENPGQFIFRFDNAKLAEIGLTPDDILSEVVFYTNGIKAGSIKSDFEDNDIVLKMKDFEDNLTPNNVNNLIIQTRVGKIRVGDVADYSFEKAVSAINREDGKIIISVESEFESGYLPTDIQPKFVEFAERYNFPEGISFTSGGETSENADLIISTGKSLLITLFLMFSILVFQFNSYSQPAVILYSVILALVGVNIGLYITGNPYSMPFGIGFIALTGVVVNDAIILLDRINKNLEKGIDSLHAVLNAGKTRLQPIIVTTLTTIFGILPLALQDEFWAGLGFTIVFGLLAGSTMTLFVIPSLYYELFLDKKKAPWGVIIFGIIHIMIISILQIIIFHALMTTSLSGTTILMYIISILCGFLFTYIYVNFIKFKKWAFILVGIIYLLILVGIMYLFIIFSSGFQFIVNINLGIWIGGILVFIFPAYLIVRYYNRTS